MSIEWSLIGEDGREYGPVSFETLLAWAREGRVAADSPVRGGHGPWQTARDVEPLRAALPPERPPVTGAATDSGSRTVEAARLPATFSAGAFLKEAWRLLSWEDIAILGAVTLALHAVATLGGIGAALSFVIGGAVWTGLWMLLLERIDGRRPSFDRVFGGFDRFLDAFLAHLIMAVGVGVGLLLLVVPGVVLFILWAFVYAVLAETRMGVFDALSESSRLTRGFRWELLGLTLLSALVLLLGSLAFGIGFYIALPVVMAAFALAYRFLQARNGRAAEPSPA